MKRTKLVILLVVVLALLTSMTVFAGSAYNASFTTSITYQNVGADAANIIFNFYPEGNGTAIPINKTLPKDAGSSLYVGGLSEISAGFNGSVVMASDQPVVATLVQISSDADVKNRPLSNGFDGGSDEVLLATVLKNKFNSTSRFSVQNASSGAVDLTIKFYNADAPAAAPITVNHANLPVGAAKYFDMGTLSQITASTFNGSAVITAVETGTTTPAPIVASALEMSTNGPAVSAFEGAAGGGATVYMPSALCNAFGGQESFYAIQNTSQTINAVVKVTFSNGNIVDETIAPGAKKSVRGCSGGNAAGFSGAATITSTGGEVIVIGKVSGGGLSTAFLGASDGAEMLALPYVRWSKDQFASGARQRAYISIQNVGGALAAGDVVVNYVDRNGKVVGTQSLGALATGAKANSNASQATVAAGATQAELDEFGYVGGFGGSVIVEGPAGSELVAVVRIVSAVSGGQVGEDYNGIATQ